MLVKKILITLDTVYIITQRIPEPSCTRKETININILVASRKSHRKINSTTHRFLQLFQHIPVTIKSTSPDMKAVFHFLGAVLVIETLQI